MSTDDDGTDQDGSGSDGENANIKQLREKARRADAAEKELADLQRERAFDKAGIPDTKIAGYFRKAYEGDMAPEVLKAAAIEAGLLQDDGTDKGSVSDEERAANQRTQEVSGGTPELPPKYEEELAAAKTQDEVFAVMAKYKQPFVPLG